MTWKSSNPKVVLSRGVESRAKSPPASEEEGESGGWAEWKDFISDFKRLRHKVDSTDTKLAGMEAMLRKALSCSPRSSRSKSKSKHKNKSTVSEVKPELKSEVKHESSSSKSKKTLKLRSVVVVPAKKESDEESRQSDSGDSYAGERDSEKEVPRPRHKHHSRRSSPDRRSSDSSRSSSSGSDSASSQTSSDDSRSRSRHRHRHHHKPRRASVHRRHSTSSDSSPRRHSRHGAKSHQKKSKFGISKYIPRDERDKPMSVENLWRGNAKLTQRMYEKGYDIGGMLKHSVFLSEKSSSYKPAAVAEYDEKVRRKARKKGVKAFKASDSDLNSMCLGSDSIKPKSSQASGGGSSSSRRRNNNKSGGSRSKAKYCINYNSEGGCSFPTCNYPHVCSFCYKGGHTVASCYSLRPPTAGAATSNDQNRA